MEVVSCTAAAAASASGSACIHSRSPSTICRQFPPPRFISSNSPSSSSSSSFWGINRTRLNISTSSSSSSCTTTTTTTTTIRRCGRSKGMRRRAISVSAVFERFTERAIKAIMFSQREAKSLGYDLVFTQHLLLGLITEDTQTPAAAATGFLGSGITLQQARVAVHSIWHDHQPLPQATHQPPSFSSSAHVPFSISTKRVFEAAVDFSRTMSHNFIGPEHIAIGLFTVDDGSAARVLKKYLLY